MYRIDIVGNCTRYSPQSRRTLRFVQFDKMIILNGKNVLRRLLRFSAHNTTTPPIIKGDILNASTFCFGWLRFICKYWFYFGWWRGKMQMALNAAGIFTYFPIYHFKYTPNRKVRVILANKSTQKIKKETKNKAKIFVRMVVNFDSMHIRSLK